jgi:hypothetical protein
LRAFVRTTRIDFDVNARWTILEPAVSIGHAPEASEHHREQRIGRCQEVVTED